MHTGVQITCIYDCSNTLHSCLLHTVLPRLTSESMAFSLIINHKSLYFIVHYSRDSVDGTATTLQAELSVVRIPEQEEYFLFYRTSIWSVEHSQPYIQWVQRFFLQGVNRPELDVYHSVPSSVEIKTDLNYTSFFLVLFISHQIVGIQQSII